MAKAPRELAKDYLAPIILLTPPKAAQPENIRKLQMAQLELIQKQQQKKQKEEQQKVGEIKRGMRSERGREEARDTRESQANTEASLIFDHIQ